MPSTIQVVLQQDVTKVGKSGELVKVRPGFARNYLLPRSLAVAATTAHVNRINHERAVFAARAEKMKKEANEVASKLSGVKVKLARPVGEDERMFGSVTTRDIQSALEAQGHKVDKKKIVISEPIKALGEYDVVVKFVGDVSATVKVEVVKK